MLFHKISCMMPSVEWCVCVCVQGVKVHFALDASGIFHVDKADVVFEPEEPEVLS